MTSLSLGLRVPYQQSLSASKKDRVQTETKVSPPHSRNVKLETQRTQLTSHTRGGKVGMAAFSISYGLVVVILRILVSCKREQQLFS